MFCEGAFTYLIGKNVDCSCVIQVRYMNKQFAKIIIYILEEKKLETRINRIVMFVAEYNNKTNKLNFPSSPSFRMF